jgi:hypothetical protein
MPRRAYSAALAMAAIAFSPSGRAGDLHGRLALTDIVTFDSANSIEAQLGEQSRNDVVGEGRLAWEPRGTHWDFSIHTVVRFETGGGVALAERQVGYFPAPPSQSLFDLDTTWRDGGHRRASAGLDRLAVGYRSDQLVVRIGRQALSWGAGNVFHPMDLIDPFAPDAIDAEYKPGVDMVYGQWLFTGGSDLQAVVVPRRQSQSHAIASDASTIALHYRQTFGARGATFLLARDRGDWTLGLGFSGPLAGANWNLEWVPTRESGGGIRHSELANIRYGMRLVNRNATWFAEYYHNGFGIDSTRARYAMLPADLSDRLAQGQLYTVSRNYLSGGMSLEWTPLLSLAPSAVVDLDDGSFLLSAEARLSLSDNAYLVIGGRAPIGSRGSEYGGLPLSDDNVAVVGLPKTAYVQLRQYF